MKENSFKVEIVPIGYRYYNEDNGFGVMEFKTKEMFCEKGLSKFKDDDYFRENRDFDEEIVAEYSGIMTGNMPKLDLNCKYTVKLELSYNSKYSSWQFVYESHEDTVPKGEREVKNFLKFTLTDRQADEIYNTYPNFIDLVIQDKVSEIDVSLLNGIGEATLEKIVSKINERYVLFDIIEYLAPFGIKYNKIKKIVDTFNSPLVAKNEIKNNFYILTKVKGIGFKEADKIALKINPELRCSKERLIAFIRYTLNDISMQEGHTYISVEQMISKIRSTIKECTEIAKDYMNEIEGKNNSDIFMIYDSKITLKSMYYKESNIIELLNDLNSSENKTFDYDIDKVEGVINKVEEKQGFKFSATQKDAIYSALKNNVLLIAGKAGCVDNETEYFNGVEWVKISEYKEGDMVLQFNPEDKSAELVKPIEYHKYLEDTMYKVANYKGTVDQVLSLEHNFAYMTSKGHMAKKSLSEVIETHNNSQNGFSGKIINAFNYKGGKGIDLTDEEIRLMVAILADGTFKNMSDNSKYCRINIKKDRKKKRIVKLLNDAKIPFEKHRWNNTDENYMNYTFYAPLKLKTYPLDWYNATVHQLEVICSESLLWDGRIDEKGRRSYYSTNKSDADFIQFAFSSLGYTSNISIDDRLGQKQKSSNGKTYIRKSVCYRVHISKKKFRATSLFNATDNSKVQKIEPYTKHDGYKYCFSVPSGYLVLRRNDKIFVTGNSGKTTVVNGIFKVFEELYEHLIVSQCALSAKAARRMYEVTGKPAYTIHSTLGSKGGNDFAYNKENKMKSDVIICDEASMNNVDIMWRLIQAVEKGSKLMFVFDFAQLPAIGAGAVAHDLLEHSHFAKFKFEEVHRQGQDSNILMDANKIRKMKKPFKEMKPRVDRGDIVYLFAQDRSLIHKKAIDLYMSALKKYDIDDVMMICPRRNTVLNSVEKLNNHIQPKYIGESFSTIKNGVYKYHIGDVIIHRKNNQDLNVMNGEVGKIIDIPNGSKMVVDYGFNISELMERGVEVKKIVEYNGFEQINQTELAYSYSVHSAQGSQAKAVIVVLDNTHYTLLDTTLLYTAITRAKEKCFVISEPEAFKRCMTHHKTYSRNTNMKQLLLDNAKNV